MTNEKRERVFERRPSQGPDGGAGEEGSIFERVPEGIKRGFEHLLRDGRLKHMLGDLKLPKEIVTHIMNQIDDTKQATVRVISKEVRLFLERTNLSEELANLLTQISFEVKTQVRFVPSDKALKKEVKTTIEPSTDPDEPAEETESESASDSPGSPSAPPRPSSSPASKPPAESSSPDKNSVKS